MNWPSLMATANSQSSILNKIHNHSIRVPQLLRRFPIRNSLPSRSYRRFDVASLEDALETVVERALIDDKRVGNAIDRRVDVGVGVRGVDRERRREDAAHQQLAHEQRPEAL